MKKFGGVLLIGLGLVLIIFPLIRLIAIVLEFVDKGASAYGIGVLVGSVFGTVLMGLLGFMALKRGRKILGS